MLLQIDFASQEPIYRQIRTQVVHAVATGELVPGDSLPSVRSLASDLGVNMHTVNKAYAMLRDEGYVQVRGRSGAFIADAARVASPARSKETRDRIADGLTQLALEYRARGGTLKDFLQLTKTQAEIAFSSKEGDVR